MPEGFLCADAILRLVSNVTDGIVVNDKVIAKTVEEYMPFMATENLMMEATKRGASRQDVHEIIRQCSMEATKEMKQGLPCRLLEMLAEYDEIPMTLAEMEDVLAPEKYTGRCPQQVERIVAEAKAIVAAGERLDDGGIEIL